MIQRRREIGERAFDRGYRQLAISDQERYFPSLTACLVPGVPSQYVSEGAIYFAGVDISTTRRAGNCIVVGALNPNGTRVPVHVVYGAWRAPELAHKIIDAFKTWRLQVIMVENNAYQQSLIEWVQEISPDPIPVEGFTTGANKLAIEMGLPSLELEFQQRLWVIADPQHDIDCRCDWCRWLLELRQSPAVASMDGVMATWMLLQAFRLRSTPLSEVEKGPDKEVSLDAYKSRWTHFGGGGRRWGRFGKFWTR